MAFPSTPLDIRTELQLAGIWTDISADVYVRDAKNIDVGLRDQGARTDPGKLTFTLNNAGGKYSPRNAMSPLYGLIGRNTPVRVSVPGPDNYLEMPGISSASASTPDTAALDITGDLDLRIELSASWYRPGHQNLLGKWGGPGERSYLMRLQDGALSLYFSLDGAYQWFGYQKLPALPERAALRVTLDVDNGAGQWAVAHYWAESIAGPWTQMGATLTSTSTSPPAPLVLWSGPAPLQVGPSDLTSSPPRLPFDGKAYRAEVRSGINGTIVANPDFTAQASGATGFTDAAGRTWTMNGSARITNRATRFTGEISSWPKEWQPDGSDVWTSVLAQGVLRRYGQGAKALDSTLRRRIPSGSPVAYWPMEEDRDATRASSPILGVRPAAMTGVEFAALDTLPSSSALPKISAGGTLSAIVPAAADGQWQVEFVYNADDKPPSGSGPVVELIGISTTGTVRRWTVSMREGAARFAGTDASGTEIVAILAGVGADVFHGWVRLRLWARDTGTGSVQWRGEFQDVGGDAGGVGGTVTGSAGHVTAVTATWGAALEGWGIGHLSVLAAVQSSLYTGSDNGYAGENAWQRMLRLASEESIPLGRIAGPLTPERVGPQRPQTLVDLLQAAADVDGGLLVEDRQRLGLIYRDRSSLYTQQPVLTLDYTAPGLAYPLVPVEDDDATRNDITVKRDGGSEARAVLESGPLSVQPPPDGIGLYDESVTLALNEDTQTEPHAFWRLHLGTFDGARFPSVGVMLHKAPELIDTVLAMREGDVIRLTNLPPWVSHDDVDLVVQGWHETVDLYRWDVTFNCSPAGPWMTAKADHPVYAKADTGGAELADAVTATATELAVRTTVGPQWTQDPAEAPFFVRFGGEVARADAVGQLLSPNPWFDSGLTGWVGQATGAVELSTAITHPRGVVSARVTPNGAAASNSLAMASGAPAVPGAAYSGCFWVYSPGGWSDYRVSLDWFRANGTLISTTSGPLTVIPAGQWTHVLFTATAPTDTASVVVRARQGATPPASAISYLWGLRLLLSGSGPYLSDTFTRTATGGWGTADTGQAWVDTGGSAGDYAVTGGVGQHIMSTANVLRYTVTPAPSADVDVRTDWALDKVAVGDSNYVFLMARYTDTNHFYFVRAQVAPSGNVFLTLRKRNGAETQLGSSFTAGTYTPGTWYTMRLRVFGSTIQAKCWPRSTPEPDTWHLSATDLDLTAVGAVGARSLVGTSTTQTLPITASFDNLLVADVQRFTVTRSVNGVAKAHAADTPLSLAYPAIASL